MYNGQFSIPSVIKRTIDHIPLSANIVIDCGHIDNPQMKPDELSILTFRTGVKLASYFLKRKYAQVRLAIVINDMYDFNSGLTQKEAKKKLKQRRKEYKKTGVYDLFPQEYRDILIENRFPENTWLNLLIQKTESGAKFAAKQVISTFQELPNNFQKNIVEGADGTGYQLDNEVVQLTSKKGAPLCRTIVGVLNNEYEKIMFLIYLIFFNYFSFIFHFTNLVKSSSLS